jgi:hypothetical protein
MAYSLTGYDYAYKQNINYGVFSTIENVNKAIDELVDYHIKKLADDDDDLNDDFLNNERELFRNSLNIIKNGDIDKLIYPN